MPRSQPFGAVFVARTDDDAERWIGRADATLDPSERDRQRRALDAVRRRGYSFSIAIPRRPEFAKAVESLTSMPESDGAHPTRGDLIREMMHSG